MRVTTAFNRLLRLPGAAVMDVSFGAEGVIVTVRLRRRRRVCSRCGQTGRHLHVHGRRLKRCEIIALRLPSGWRVKGRVRWRLGRQCGITFCNPVAEFARILCEGAAVKSPAKRKRARTTTACTWCR